MTKKRKAAATNTTSARKRRRVAGRSARGALSIATSSRRSVKERVAAIAETPTAVLDDDDSLQAMLKVLRNLEEPIEVRLAALQAIQAASFSVVAFESCRADYIVALRSIVGDPDPELRQRVLGILSREKDGFAQKKLLDGLKHPGKALVPPEKALQLLSYDVHAEAYEIAREIVDKPPSDIARREALRLLAADASASPVFERILRNKNESPEIRRISASALHAIAPDALQKHARAILLDASESDEVRAASLTALTQFGDAEAVAQDDVLKKRAAQLSLAPSGTVKKSAQRFVEKFGE